jgi:hypothetical protein
MMPVAGHRTVVEGFLRLHEVEGRALGHDRAVNLPGLAVTVAEMIESLRRVAGDRPLGEIRVEPDPFIERIVATWPARTDSDRALALGLPQDRGLDDIVRAYIEDFLPA